MAFAKSLSNLRAEHLAEAARVTTARYPVRHVNQGNREFHIVSAEKRGTGFFQKNHQQPEVIGTDGHRRLC